MFNNDKHRYMFNASVVYDIADWLNVAARVRIDNTYTTRLTRFHASSSPLRTGDNATKPMGSYNRNEGEV